MKLSHLLELEHFHFRPVTPVQPDQPIRWVAVIDIPNAWHWIQEGQLLLTTGYTWPHDPEQLREYIQRIAEKKPVGIALAVPHFFEQFPEAARLEAEKLGLAAFELPWEIPFGVLTEAIHKELLREHYVLLERSEQIHRALTQSVVSLAGFGELARVLGGLLGREVAFLQNHGGVLGAHPPDARFAVPEQAHHLSKAAHFAHSIVCPVRVGNVVSGSVVIQGGEGPLSELEMRAAEHAAVVAALQLVHERELALQEARLGYAFFETLLDGGEALTPQVRERVARLGFRDDQPYWLGVFQLHALVPLSEADFKAREALAADLRSILKFWGAPQLLGLLQSQVVFVVPADRSPEQLWNRLKRPGISVAFSQQHVGLAGVAQAHQEVQQMVPYLKEGQLHHHAQMLVPRILEGDKQAREAFLDDIFANLARENLQSTLLALVRCGFHLKRTASVLGVHINTLRYRLERIEALANLRLDDPDTRFRLQLAGVLLDAASRE